VTGRLEWTVLGVRFMRGLPKSVVGAAASISRRPLRDEIIENRPGLEDVNIMFY
jgi:hypothetical protein